MERMDLAIIGGGIGGLTLALALKKAGIDCRVFERVSHFGQVGAGIQIAPNATKLLFRLGLQDKLEHVGVRPIAQVFSRWDDDRTLSTTSLSGVAETFGGPHITLHRADLHETLLAATDKGLVRLASDIIGIDRRDTQPILTFADGSQVEAQIVVGADGIHSMTRGLLVDDQPRYSGQSVFRGLVPADRLSARFAQNVNLWLGPNQHCGCYPISAGETISFAATVPLERSGKESWTEEGSVDDLLAAYAGWTPDLLALFAAAESVSVWALYDRAPVEQIQQGMIALLGDAAHPMLPFLSQGANQAIEDAFVLASCLQRFGAGEKALSAYDAIRGPRSRDIQAMSLKNNKQFHLPDGEEQRDRDAAFSKAGMSGLDPAKQQWLYGYDAEEDASAYLSDT